MKAKPKRKNQPVAVRRRILEATACLALAHGLNGFSLEAVAEKAGISKGGLLHHFPTRQSLLEGMMDDRLHRLEQRIETIVARDPETNGAFTRAYLRAILSATDEADDRLLALLSLASLADPALNQRWNLWLEKQLLLHRTHDDSLACRVVRYAADGLWLADLMDGPAADPERRNAVLAFLEALSQR